MITDNNQLSEVYRSILLTDYICEKIKRCLIIRIGSIQPF